MFNEKGIKEFFSNVEEEMTEMAKISLDEKNEDDKTVEICSELCSIVKDRLDEECDAYIAGTRAMGLSDGKKLELVIFLDVGQNRFHANRDYKENVQLLERLEKVLKTDPNWNIFELKRSLPGLIVIHVPSTYKCELNVTNGLSVHNSAMIGHFFEIQPEAVKLYHFINKWLKINNVHFKDFILTLLLMNYLQEKNYMPSAFHAQYNVPQSYIEGIPVSFDSSRTIKSYGVKKMTYYYSHVRGFFRYYSNFNFVDNVISTYYGYPVEKSEYIPKLDYDSPMCIPAFLNKKCNTSRKITDVQVHNFMMVCDASYKYLVDNDY